MGRDRRITTSPEETVAFGRELGASLERNRVVTLFGDLGAGKTTLIKGIVEGVTGTPAERVISPTFVYLNTYEGAVPLYHFDLYRLKGPQDFLDLGFDDYLEAGGICCIEWSERITPLLPSDRLTITLSHLGEEKRDIEIG